MVRGAETTEGEGEQLGVAVVMVMEEEEVPSVAVHPAAAAWAVG